LLITADSYIIASETRLNISQILNLCKRSPMEKERKLTFKQELFAKAYVATKGNGIKSYKRAGYACENMADTAIGSEASDLLRHPVVSQKIEDLREEMHYRLGVDEESLLIIGKELLDSANDTDEIRGGVAALNELNKMLGRHKAPQASKDDVQIHKVQLVGMPDNGHVNKEEKI